MRPRQIAPVALVLALTVVGFVGARVLGERDAQRDSERRADVAAAHIRGRVEQAASLTESLGRFMQDASGTGVTSPQFARNALRWLSPADFPAAAWVERVADSQRAAYERRLGEPIVTPDEGHRVVPGGSRPSYLPATLVSGFAPLAVPGVDLSREPGMAAALKRATRLDGVAATRLAGPRTGAKGLFLVAPAPNLTGGVLDAGFVVVFIPDQALRAAATGTKSLQLTMGGRAGGGSAARKTFTAAGQRFAVAVPRESVSGAAEILPWIILAAGLVLAGLAAALGVIAGRRARAQDELDRIFTLSSDMIVVSNFKGYFTRVNPAAERILGYTQAELVERPYLDFVYPDDRERTAAEAAALGEGKATLSFENRYVRKDGSHRVLEWTATPVVEDGVIYAVARDVTERREAKAEVERLADEQAALRRVATLVARGTEPVTVFRAVCNEAQALLGADAAGILRFHHDRTVTVMANSGGPGEHGVGARLSFDPGFVVDWVHETHQAARFDTDDPAAADMPEIVRTVGVRSAVGSPIVVYGELWGVIMLASVDRSLPLGMERRLADFTEHVATAIANAESGEALARLAEEQAALRRVATLVAENVPSGELFAAVVQEAGTLLGADYAGMIRYEDDATVTALASWAATGELPPIPDRFRTEPGDPATMVAETRQPARVDDWTVVPGPLAAFLRDELAVRSSVGSPIVVEGRLWGVLGVHSKGQAPLPPDTESRIEQFTDLLATAIANRAARTEVARLADEQAALRRVATLVARDAPREEVFTGIASEIGHLFGLEETRMVRYDDDRTGVVVASSGPTGDFFPVGYRVSADVESAVSRVLRTGEAVRIDDAGTATGAIAEAARSMGIRSVVAAPISVEGRRWGAISAGTTQDEPLSPAIESRLGQFTELMATAVANTESRAEVERLAQEQAALRRVATLVAKEAPPAEVFAKVAEELAKVLGDVDCSLFRDEGDGTASAVALWGASVSAGVRVGTRLPVDGDGVIASVLREGRPCRIDDYSATTGAIAERGRELEIRSAVGCPIVVGGRTWGAMGAARYEAVAFPPEAETRIAQFADLVATAIANAEAHTEVERLADEQAALRRVATLVAEGPAPTAVFDAVAAEMTGLLGADGVTLSRYEPNDEVIVVAHRGSDPRRVPPGTRVSHQGENVTSFVRRSKRSARMEHQQGRQGAFAGFGRDSGVRSSVGAPIVVDGRLWGVAIANWRSEQSPPADTEERMAQFAELLDTAIANADSRAELMASRARLVAASDEARRRFERDLHDGVQQRLVSLALELRAAEEMAPRENEGLARQLAHVVEGLAGALEDLRELSRGIHPAILSEGGLVPALKALGRRSAVPVELDLAVEMRLADHVEVGAYYVASEALANAAKHARASVVEVRARAEDSVLELRIDDDGVGGADPARGSGLTGLTDRVEALGGTITIASPPGEGTSLRVELPLDTQ